MSKPKFPPWPWTVRRIEQKATATCHHKYYKNELYDKEGRRIFLNKENAALIVVAPEMYDVLSYIQGAISDMLSPDGFYSTIFINPEIKHRLHVMGLRVDEILEKARGEQ